MVCQQSIKLEFKFQMLHFYYLFLLFETYLWGTNSFVRIIQIPLLLLATTKRPTLKKSMKVYATKKPVNFQSKKSFKSCTLPNKWLNRSSTTSTLKVKDKSIFMSLCAQLHLCIKTMKRLNNFYLTFSRPIRRNSISNLWRIFSRQFLTTFFTWMLLRKNMMRKLDNKNSNSTITMVVAVSVLMSSGLCWSMTIIAVFGCRLLDLRQKNKLKERKNHSIMKWRLKTLQKMIKLVIKPPQILLGNKPPNKCILMTKLPREPALQIKNLTLSTFTGTEATIQDQISDTIGTTKSFTIQLHVELFWTNSKKHKSLTLNITMTLRVWTSILKRVWSQQVNSARSRPLSFGMQWLLKLKLSFRISSNIRSAVSPFHPVESMLLQVQWVITTRLLFMTLMKRLLSLMAKVRDPSSTK